MSGSLSQGPRQSRVAWGMTQGLLLALFLLLVLRPGVLGNLSNSLEWNTLDLWSSLREPRPSRSVVLLSVDEATVRSWNGRTFDAPDIARALRALRAHDARAVALDFPLLCDSRMTIPGREPLVEAIRFNGRVALPFEFRRASLATDTSPIVPSALQRFALSFPGAKRDEAENAGTARFESRFTLRAPANDLLGAAAGAGHLSFEFDRNGRARRLPLGAFYGGQTFPAFALATARVAGLSPRVTDEPLFLLYPSGAFRVEEENDNLHVPFGVISLSAALGDERLWEQCRGKVVVMGVTAPGFGARFPAPGGGRVTECELSALALDNLIGEGQLRQAPLLWHWMLTLLPSLVVGGLAANWRPAWSAMLAVFCALLVALVSLSSFGSNLWLDASVPWLAIAATCLVGASGQVRRRERESVSIASTVEALAQVAELVAVGKTPDELLGGVVSFAAKTLRANGASAFLLDEASGELRIVAATGPNSAPLIGQRLQPGEGIAGRVVSEGQALMMQDSPGETVHASRFDLLTGLETRSILAVPLKGRGTVVGALEVVNHEGETPFSQTDLELLGAIANQAAVALDNVRLYDRLAFRVEQSQDALAVANRELQADKTLMQTVLHSMSDGVVVTDEQGRIQLVNPAATVLFPELGRPVMGQPLGHVLPDFPLAAVPLSLPDAALSSEPTSVAVAPSDAREARDNQAVLLFRGSSEAPVAIEGHVAPLRGEQNELAGLVAVFADVTQRREVEQAKSDFVSFVAHEMRSPLTSISGFSAMLQRGETGGNTLPTPTRARFLGLIRGESERLTRLINTLLDVAKLEAGRTIELNRDWVELEPLAQLALENQRAYSSRHTLTSQIAPGLPLVFADADKVLQILINLLSNAQKYSPGGEIVLGALFGQNEVEVWVRDQGPGIAPQQRELLFSRFGRVPHSAQGIGAGAKPTGTGLGLFLTKHLVEAHGGRIWVESQAGQGATFLFTLPVEERTDKKP